jgi:hypothetical protein
VDAEHQILHPRQRHQAFFPARGQFLQRQRSQAVGVVTVALVDCFVDAHSVVRHGADLLLEGQHDEVGIVGVCQQSLLHVELWEGGEQGRRAITGMRWGRAGISANLAELGVQICFRDATPQTISLMIDD